MFKEIFYENEDLKKQALSKLKSNLKTSLLMSVAVVILLGMVMNVFMGIALAFKNYILYYVMLSVLMALIYGFASRIQNNIYLNISNGNEVKFSDFKGAFISSNKTIKLQAVFQVMYLCFYLGIGLFFYLMSGYLPKIYNIPLRGNAYFYAAAILLAIILFMCYLNISMSWFILIENPDMEIKDVLKESITMMKGNKIKLACLLLSFLGWIALIVLGVNLGSVLVSVGITTLILSYVGMLYLNLYMGVSLAEFYLHLKGK